MQRAFTLCTTVLNHCEQDASVILQFMQVHITKRVGADAKHICIKYLWVY